MADRNDLEEPRIQPPPSRPERAFNKGLERAASFLASGVAAILAVFVALALAGVALAAWKALVRDHDPMHAALAGLDGAFVVVILLELVHTTLSRGSIFTQVQEFLVIGITSAIRNGLETAAGGGGRDPRETAIDLAISAGAAILLVGALWLVRERLQHERRAGHRVDGGSRRKNGHMSLETSS